MTDIGHVGWSPDYQDERDVYKVDSRPQRILPNRLTAPPMNLQPPVRKERCCQGDCAVMVETDDRCGAPLFGTRDDPGDGCGKIMCSEHLWGHAGPFYCRPCWDARKAKRAQEAKVQEDQG